MIIVMIVIVVFSNQSGETLHTISDVVAEKVNIETGFSWQLASEMPLMFGLSLRKWAHIGLYGVLGLTTVMQICS